MPAQYSYILNPRIEAELMSGPEAQKRLGVCPRTLITYSQQHPISRKMFGRRMYSAVAIEMLFNNDLEALDLYEDGERLDPKVRQYYQRLNIELPAFLFAGV